MTSPRLAALRGQHDEVRQAIELIERAAVDRDYTETEDADLAKLYERAESLKPEIETLARKQESLNATAEILSRVANASPAHVVERAVPRQPQELSLEQYLANFYNVHNGSLSQAEFVERSALYIERADQATSGVSGIVPTPIVGNLIKFIDASRPVFSSFTSHPLPASGASFTRPRITQNVAVAKQAAELTAGASQALTIVDEEVTKQVFHGTLRIPVQTLEYTDPAYLGVVTQDFADQYALATEQAACDHLMLAPGQVSGYSASSVGSLVTSYVNAFVDVYDTAKRMPDTVWLSLDQFAVLAGTTNTNNDRTALSMIREAIGQLGAGVSFVVSPNFEDDTRIVGCSNLVEGFEKQVGLLTAQAPDVFGAVLAYAGFVAFYAREEGFTYLGAQATPST